MKLYKRSISSPPSPPILTQLLCRPIREALAELRIVAVPGAATWLVTGVEEGTILVKSGIGRTHIWTARELESLPLTQRPQTLGTCLRAFGDPAVPKIASR